MENKAVADFMSNYGKYLPGTVLAGGVGLGLVILCVRIKPEDIAKGIDGIVKVSDNITKQVEQLAQMLGGVEETQTEDHQNVEEQTDDPSFILFSDLKPLKL